MKRKQRELDEDAYASSLKTSFSARLDLKLQQSVGGGEIKSILDKSCVSVNIVNNRIENSIIFYTSDNEIYGDCIVRLQADVFLEKMDQIEKYYLDVKKNHHGLKIYMLIEGFEKILMQATRNMYLNVQKGIAVNVNLNEETIETLLIRFNLCGINVMKTTDLTCTLDYISYFLKRMESPKKGSTIMDFHSHELKSAKSLEEMYKAQLCEVVHAKAADGIMKKFPTYYSLLREYSSNKSIEEKKALLSDVEMIYEAGKGRVHQKIKKVGRSLSERLYTFYCQ